MQFYFEVGTGFSLSVRNEEGFGQEVVGHEKQNAGPSEGLKIRKGGGTVYSNGFYADIWNHHQVQQYSKSCLKSFLQNFGSFEVPWGNIFDTDIFRCINTYIKVLYLTFFRIFMPLQMSVSKILPHGRLWYFKTTKIL